VAVERRGEQRPLDAVVERAAYRVVQEALTSAGKHAPGAPVAVILDYQAANLVIRVVNRRATRSADAAAQPRPLPSGGHGLIGLRERVHALGGELRAVLTTFHLDEYVYAALEAGASGFLLKDTPPREIAAAVRAVADGSQTLSPAVAKRLISEYVGRRRTPRRDAARRRIAALSEREREVLALVGRGLSNAEAAQALTMSEATAKTYVSRMLTKLGMDNRTQAAILAHEAGLLED
jgi:DNA-binding NarL/FixJ family response regulator